MRNKHLLLTFFLFIFGIEASFAHNKELVLTIDDLPFVGESQNFHLDMIITECFPGRQLSLCDGDFETIIYHDDGPRLTWEEILQKDAELSLSDWKREREKEYKAQGINEIAKINALWSHFVEGDQAPQIKLEEKIKEINDKYPAP